MDKNTLFDYLKANLYACVPELEDTDIKITDSLADLGANSVDRADIIMMTLEDVNISIPLISFKDARNIEGIIDVILNLNSKM